MATQLELLQPLMVPVKTLEKLPPLVSFFSGAGFFDLGLVRAGFNIAWSLEKDPSFCKAHDHGFKTYLQSEASTVGIPFISCVDDIRHKGPTTIKREAFGLLTSGRDFGIVGGPPCPDFSIGGKNRGQEGDRGRCHLRQKRPLSVDQNKRPCYRKNLTGARQRQKQITSPVSRHTPVCGFEGGFQTAVARAHKEFLKHLIASQGIPHAARCEEIQRASPFSVCANSCRK